jgi:hypothetical protein
MFALRDKVTGKFATIDLSYNDETGIEVEIETGGTTMWVTDSYDAATQVVGSRMRSYGTMPYPVFDVYKYDWEIVELAVK